MRDKTSGGRCKQLNPTKKWVLGIGVIKKRFPFLPLLATSSFKVSNVTLEIYLLEQDILLKNLPGLFSIFLSSSEIRRWMLRMPKHKQMKRSVYSRRFYSGKPLDAVGSHRDLFSSPLYWHGYTNGSKRLFLLVKEADVTWKTRQTDVLSKSFYLNGNLSDRKLHELMRWVINMTLSPTQKNNLCKC